MINRKSLSSSEKPKAEEVHGNEKLTKYPTCNNQAAAKVFSLNMCKTSKTNYLSLVSIAARIQIGNMTAGNLIAAAQAAGRFGVPGTRAAIAGGTRAAEVGYNICKSTAVQAGAKGGVVGVATGAAIGLVVIPVALPLVGFTVGGVAAGSTAAAIHSAIGNVAAGSLFAAAQSAGVIGMAAGTQVAIAGGAGVVGAAIGAGVGAIPKP